MHHYWWVTIITWFFIGTISIKISSIHVWWCGPWVNWRILQKWVWLISRGRITSHRWLVRCSWWIMNQTIKIWNYFVIWLTTWFGATSVIWLTIWRRSMWLSILTTLNFEFNIKFRGKSPFMNVTSLYEKIYQLTRTIHKYPCWFIRYPTNTHGHDLSASLFGRYARKHEKHLLPKILNLFYSSDLPNMAFGSDFLVINWDGFRLYKYHAARTAKS